MLPCLYILIRSSLSNSPGLFQSTPNPVPNPHLIKSIFSSLPYATYKPCFHFAFDDYLFDPSRKHSQQMQCRKYILIKEIYAKTPFNDCHLRFVVTRRLSDQPLHSQIQFGARPVSAHPQEYLEFSYSPEEPHVLALFVFAVSSNNRVANIGCLPLSTDENVWEKKQYLKGIIQQNGFVIYSTRDDPFPERRPPLTLRSQDGEANEREQSVESFGHSAASRGEIQQTPLKLFQNSSDFKNEFGVVAQTESPFDGSVSVRSEPVISTNKTGPKEKLIQVQDTGEEEHREGPNFETNERNPEKQRKNCQVFSQAATILKEHKLKNSNYIQDLQEMEAQFQQQRQRLQSLGLKGL